ncbi:hypothetical protein MXB_5639, partial [Myxobolus squamalis]
YKPVFFPIKLRHIVTLKIYETNSFDIIRIIKISTIHDVGQNDNTLKIYFKSNSIVFINTL